MEEIGNSKTRCRAFRNLHVEIRLLHSLQLFQAVMVNAPPCRLKLLCSVV